MSYVCQAGPLRMKLLFMLESKKTKGVDLRRLNLLRVWWVSL